MYISQKRMFDVKCSDCNKSATVPFEPIKGKPVYCKTCFSKHRVKQREKPRVNTRFNMKNAWAIRGDNWQGKKEKRNSIFRRA